MKHTKDEIYAKCLDDWMFLDVNNKPVKDIVRKSIEDLAGCDEWYCYQKYRKEKKNNTHIQYTKHPPGLLWCNIAAKKCIVERQFRLDGKKDEPLAIDKRNVNSKEPSFFHKRLVESWLNKACKAIYGVQPL